MIIFSASCFESFLSLGTDFLFLSLKSRVISMVSSISVSRWLSKTPIFFRDHKLEKRIIDQIKKREIDLRLDFSSIKELAYQLSQIDTFVPDLYISIQNIFNKMLENKDLEEIHEEIENYKNYFDVRHSGRKMVFLKESE